MSETRWWLQTVLSYAFIGGVMTYSYFNGAIPYITIGTVIWTWFSIVGTLLVSLAVHVSSLSELIESVKSNTSSRFMFTKKKILFQDYAGYVISGIFLASQWWITGIAFGLLTLLAGAARRKYFIVSEAVRAEEVLKDMVEDLKVKLVDEEEYIESLEEEMNKKEKEDE